MTTKIQLEDLVTSWTDLQRQFWDSFMLGKNTNAQSEWEDTCKRPLEITHEILTSMLQTQTKFTHNILRDTNPELAESEIIDQYFDVVNEFLDAGIRSQNKLLENWFSLIREFEKQADTSTMMQWNPLTQKMNLIAEWNKIIKNVFETWENAAEKTLTMQNEFVSQMVPIENNSSSTSKKPSSRRRKQAAA